MSRRDPDVYRCMFCGLRCDFGRHVEVHEQDCSRNPANARERAAIQHPPEVNADAR